MPIELSNGMPSRLVTSCNCGCVLMPAPRPDNSSALRSNTVASQPMLRSMLAANRPPTEPPMMSARWHASYAYCVIRSSSAIRRPRSLTLPRAHILFDLLRRHRAGDHAGRHGPRQQPAERELEQADGRCAIANSRSWSSYGPVPLVDDVGRVVAAVGEPRVLRRGVAPVFAAQKAAGQRSVGQEASCRAAPSAAQVALDLARQQAVFVLAGDEGCGADRAPRCRARRPTARARSSSSRSRAPCPSRTSSSSARNRLLDRRTSDRDSGPDRDRS